MGCQFLFSNPNGLSTGFLAPLHRLSGQKSLRRRNRTDRSWIRHLCHRQELRCPDRRPAGCRSRWRWSLRGNPYFYPARRAYQETSVPDIDAKAIILAGPTTELASIGNSAIVMEAFNYSLTRTFVLAIASGTLAFASSLAMEWGNVKRRTQRLPGQRAHEN